MAITAAFAAAACQQRTNPGEQQPTPADGDASPSAPGGTAPNNAAGSDRGQQQSRNGQTSNAAAGAHGAMPTFEELDVSHHGYLTETEAAANPVVGPRFKACDTDSDGHLTKAEFDACKPAP